MRNGHFITDYHCHSTVSPDGHNTMREMAEAAVRLGVDDLCFIDHIEPLPLERAAQGKAQLRLGSHARAVP